MKPASRWTLRGGIALAVVAGVVLIARGWVIPRLIAGSLRSQFHGPARFDDWWLSGSSAGVIGLALAEGPGANSEIWLSARRVETDLSLGGLFSGRLTPKRIVLDAPKLRLHFDRDGKIHTRGPFAGPAVPRTSVPDIEIRDAEVMIEQDGRPSLTLLGVSGNLSHSSDGQTLRLASDDPVWGRWTADGRIALGFKEGSIRLASGPGFVASDALTSSIPFVHPDVWSNVSPSGRLDVVATFTLTDSGHPDLRIATEVTLRDATAGLPNLQIIAEHANGRIVVDGALVKLDHLEGRALKGTIGADGTLDFRAGATKIDVNLTLGKIDVTSAPAAWQLGEVGATGLLTGKAELRVVVDKGTPDFGGSSGEAVIEGATLGGIPIKSLQLAMKAQGEDLQYESKTGPQASAPTSARPGHLSLAWASLMAFQTTPPTPVGPGPGKTPTPVANVGDPAAPRRPAFRLPKSITTQIELQDVDLVRLIERLETLTKIKIPVPIAGHLALKAEATIPIGAISDLKGYAFHGHADLTGASIDGVDLGRLAADIDLDKGTLQVKDLRGVLVEKPSGNAKSPPHPTPPMNVDAPLIPGAFRGSIRAELSPPGRLDAHLEGDGLPVGEIVAPYFPRPTPVSGAVTTTFTVGSNLAAMGEARSWTGSGTIRGRTLAYHGSSLDAIATSFRLDRGRLILPDIAATLDGQPLSGKLDLDLSGGRAFSATVDVRGWSIGRVVGLFLGENRAGLAAGVAEGHVSLQGSLSPRSIRSDGKLVVRDAIVESIALGDVGGTWITQGDEIRVSEFHARPFSGRLTGEAAIPTVAGRPVRLRIEFASIDTAALTRSLTGDALRMTGVAAGTLSASVPPDLAGLRADLQLDAPDLTVQGVAAGKVAVTVREQGGKLTYEATADGPEGKVRFRGELPLDVGNAAGGVGPMTDAELKAAGFTLADIWNLLGVKGAPVHLLGNAAIDANLRVRRAAGVDFGMHGNLEVRDLRWGQHYPLGNLRGVLARTPSAWRIDAIRGELLGGTVSGVISGETPRVGPRPMAFEMISDRASLPKVFAFVPGLSRRIEGYGDVRINGRMEETLRATAEVAVGKARVAGIPVADLRLPAEIAFTPAGGGGVLNSRRWSARVAGGRVVGNSSLKLGLDRAFSADLNLTDIDVETIGRVESTAARPGSGKINGRLSLTGPDPGVPHRYRGKIQLELSDASLAEIPVIRELGRFLGAVQGGAFETGELHGTIANSQVFIDELTLAGRVIQLHAAGTVGFNGGLDLAVLVNTNQIIPQTGQALVGVIPGLREAIGRNEEALLRVANYFSNRLLKFRIGGTLRNPSVAIDPGAAVGEAATGFFSGVLKLPLGFAK